MRYLNPVTHSNGAQQIVVPDKPSGGEVDEAPFDDTQYVRVNGEWVAANSSGASFPTLSVDGVSALTSIFAYIHLSNVVTLYTAIPHGFNVADPIFVNGLSSYADGAATVLDVVSPTVLTYTKTGPGGGGVQYTLAPEGATVNLGTTLSDGQARTGLTIYGTEFLTYLDQLPKGHVALSYRADTSVYNTVEQPYIQLDATLKRGRLYRIVANGSASNNTINSRAVVVQRYAVDSGAAGTSSGAWGYARLPPVTVIGQNLPFSITHYYSIGSVGEADYDLSTVLCVYPEGGGSARFNAASTDAIYVSIEDMGIFKGDTGIDRSAANPTPPPTLKTYTKTWSSTTAKSYMGSGAADSSQGELDMKQGYSSYDGDSKSLWIFPAFTGAVGAASISSVRLWLYANHWNYGTGGTALIRVHGYSGAPASSPGMVYLVSSPSWGRDAGRWVTLPNNTFSLNSVSASLFAHIIAGRVLGFGVGPAGTQNQLYYGRFNKSGAKAEITYKR